MKDAIDELMHSLQGHEWPMDMPLDELSDLPDGAVDYEADCVPTWSFVSYLIDRLYIAEKGTKKRPAFISIVDGVIVPKEEIQP